MKLVTVEEIRAIEDEANLRGVSYAQMMEAAGSEVAKVALDACSQYSNKSAVGLIGPGNNGGDALVALAHLAKVGWQTSAFLVKSRAANDPYLQRVKAAGGSIVSVEQDPSLEKLASLLDTSVLLIDGVFGTGIRLPLKAEAARVLGFVSQRASRPLVVAVDCPSGVDCDTGDAAEETIPANITVCMAAVKAGLLCFPALDLAGELVVVDIGLPDELETWKAVNLQVADREMVRSMLPNRPRSAHKGTFGTVMVMGGSVNYTGAPLLAARGAYRVGAGLVRVAVPTPLHPILAGQLPEATWLLLPHDTGVIAEDAAEVVFDNLDRVNALLLGPGWGLEETTARFMERLIRGQAAHSSRNSIGFITTNRASSGAQTHPLPPLVIDADGLKLLARVQGWHDLLKGPAVLTPHPGEMALLTGLSVEEIQSNRLEIAKHYAAEWGKVVVLKGAVTVIAEPGGNAWVIPVATAALARAGTGDVLAGMIAGLVAQGLGAAESAICGAWLHAQAGLEAGRMIGHEAAVLAGDVSTALAAVLRRLSE